MTNKPDHLEINEKLVEIYKDTLLLATQYSHGLTMKFDYRFVNKSDMHNLYLKKGNVEVINLDTIGALENYRDQKNCILNMASAKRAGGGVSWGSKAQEEGLFRCSNLSLSISPNLYPLNENEGLYTIAANFFKDFHYNVIDPLLTDVVTIAAINLNKQTPSKANYEAITEEKIRFIINLPAKHHVDNLILGAWGSGVYKNDPTFIAGLFKKILIDEGSRFNFNNVIFAIINDQNSVANNYEVYKNIF